MKAPLAHHSRYFYAFFVLMAVMMGIFWSRNIAEPKKIEAQNVVNSVNVFASIGTNYFTLYGYASPQALIKLEGIGIYDQTFSRADGYFEFHNSFSPFSPREACLTAQDQLGRLSMPVCLPPFQTDTNITIGPVLLPPTLSLNKGTFFVSDEAVVSGQSIPNTEISLSTFVENNGTTKLVRNFNIIRPVEALNIPVVQTKTDGLGNFSISLPSSSADSLRLFAQTSFDNSPSPKSNTLQVTFLPIWMIVLTFLRLLLDSLLGRLFEIVLIIELLLLTVYLLRMWLVHHIFPQHSLLIRTNALPAIPIPTSLTVAEHHIPTVYHHSELELFS